MGNACTSSHDRNVEVDIPSQSNDHHSSLEASYPTISRRRSGMNDAVFAGRERLGLTPDQHSELRAELGQNQYESVLQAVNAGLETERDRVACRLGDTVREAVREKARGRARYGESE